MMLALCWAQPYAVCHQSSESIPSTEETGSERGSNLPKVPQRGRAEMTSRAQNGSKTPPILRDMNQDNRDRGRERCEPGDRKRSEVSASNRGVSRAWDWTQKKHHRCRFTPPATPCSSPGYKVFQGTAWEQFELFVIGNDIA